MADMRVLLEPLAKEDGVFSRVASGDAGSVEEHVYGLVLEAQEAWAHYGVEGSQGPAAPQPASRPPLGGIRYPSDVTHVSDLGWDIARPVVLGRRRSTRRDLARPRDGPVVAVSYAYSIMAFFAAYEERSLSRHPRVPVATGATSSPEAGHRLSRGKGPRLPAEAAGGWQWGSGG